MSTDLFLVDCQNFGDYFFSISSFSTIEKLYFIKMSCLDSCILHNVNIGQEANSVLDLYSNEESPQLTNVIMLTFAKTK